MPTWFVFILLVLVVARVTRFLVSDTFPPMRKARDRIGRSSDFFGSLITCEWCTGVWVAFAATALFMIWTSMPLPWGQAVAASFVGSWLAVKTDH